MPPCLCFRRWKLCNLRKFGLILNRIGNSMELNSSKWRSNKWAVAETPMICVLFCLPFRHLFREPFAMCRFSFAASTCLKYTFTNFRGKCWKEFPVFPGKHIYWNICFPPAMWESLNFIKAACRPSPLPPPPSPPRPPLHPQQQAPDLSSRASTAISMGTARHRERQITAGTIEWGGGHPS